MAVLSPSTQSGSSSRFNLLVAGNPRWDAGCLVSYLGDATRDSAVDEVFSPAYPSHTWCYLEEMLLSHHVTRLANCLLSVSYLV